MSLTDAFLCEGYRDPAEVWIGLRAGGALGRGTIDDPYDGGTRLGPSIPATLSCHLMEFVVGTRFPVVDVAVDDQVKIDGATGPYAAWFNGVFTVQEATSLHFVVSFINPHPPSAGIKPVEMGPMTLSIRDALGNWIKLKDVHLRVYWPVAKITTSPTSHGLPQYGAVDIATNDSFAGTYAALAVDDAMTTFRYRLSFNPGSDVAGNSCSIVRRIHRFDEVRRMIPTYATIHVGPGTFETRGYASLYSIDRRDFEIIPVGCVLRAGQRLLGAGIDTTVLRLVLPLDEWNQTAAVSSPATVDYAAVADLTIDVNSASHVAPFSLFPAPFTCGGVTLVGSFLSARRVRVVNFCVQSLPECFPLAFAADYTGVATFDVIEDCIVEQPGENNTHETTLLSVVGGFYGAGRSLIARHNYHCTTYANGISSEPIAIAGIVYNEDPEDPDGTCTVTTLRPHHRVVGQNALLTGIVQADGLPCAFNDSFLILPPPPPPSPFDPATQLLITKPPGAPAKASDLSFYDGSVYAVVGPHFFGRGALGGTGCVTEGNAFHDCVWGIYQDTGSTRDLVIRDNYFSNIGVGVYMNFPAMTAYGPFFNDTSAIVPEAPARGVFTTIQPHNISSTPPLPTIDIREGGQFAADPNNPYHGRNLQVVERRSDNQFVYQLAGALPGNNCAGRPVFAVSTVVSTMAYDSGTKVLTIVTTTAHGLPSGAYVTLDGIELPVGDPHPLYSGFVGPVTPDATDNTKFTVTLGASDPQPTQASGTGGVMDTGSVGISTLTFDSGTGKLTVITREPHGLANGDFVTVAGTTGFDGFTGPITPDPLDPSKFSVRSSDLPGFGSGGFLSKHVAAGVVRNGTVATVTTPAPHGFFLGQTFQVQGAWVIGDVNEMNGYNGVAQVTSLSQESFTYDMRPVGGSVPPGTASPTGAVAYRAHWDLRCFVVEANLVDVYPTDSTSALPPRGLVAFGLLQESIPPYIFHAFFWLENVVRHLDENIPNPTTPLNADSAGVVANTIQRGFAYQNLLDVRSVNPLSYGLSEVVTNMQNLSSAGSLFHGINGPGGAVFADLESRIEDLMAMAML